MSQKVQALPEPTPCPHDALPRHIRILFRQFHLGKLYGLEQKVHCEVCARTVLFTNLELRHALAAPRDKETASPWMKGTRPLPSGGSH